MIRYLTFLNGGCIEAHFSNEKQVIASLKNIHNLNSIKIIRSDNKKYSEDVTQRILSKMKKTK
jgi:hypothetical protein